MPSEPESEMIIEELKKKISQLSRKNEELEKVAKKLFALKEIGEMMWQCLTRDDVLNMISISMKRLVDFQSFVIFLANRDKPGRELEPRCILSPCPDLFKNPTIKASEGALEWVVSQKKPLLMEDTRNYRFSNVVEAERSAIIVPVMVENKVLGAFYVGSGKPGFYDEDALNFVNMISYQTAMALKNIDLYERTRAQSITDEVTALYTHRYFQERLEEACREYDRRYELRPFSLVLIDTDHFWQYHDTLGHNEADTVLREIATDIRSCIRDSDLGFRYGSDEFAVILSDSDKEAAVKTAQRIRETIQQRFQVLPVQITASIGVAHFPEDAKDRSGLLEVTEMSMDRSKKEGGNRVTVSAPLGRNKETL